MQFPAPIPHPPALGPASEGVSHVQWAASPTSRKLPEPQAVFAPGGYGLLVPAELEAPHGLPLPGPPLAFQPAPSQPQSALQRQTQLASRPQLTRQRFSAAADQRPHSADASEAAPLRRPDFTNPGGNVPWVSERRRATRPATGRVSVLGSGRGGELPPPPFYR